MLRSLTKILLVMGRSFLDIAIAYVFYGDKVDQLLLHCPLILSPLNKGLLFSLLWT